MRGPPNNQIMLVDPHFLWATCQKVRQRSRGATHRQSPPRASNTRMEELIAAPIALVAGRELGLALGRDRRVARILHSKFALALRHGAQRRAVPKHVVERHLRAQHLSD